MHTLDPQLTPGQFFAGKYRVERFLAKGGMGAVYVAEHVATERRVALKVLFRNVLTNRKALERFELEARVANRIQSDHVVAVLDAGFDEATQQPFLVMELLDGCDLEQLVEKRGALPPEDVVSHLRQVASALDKAHGFIDKAGQPQPIIHRDLKPENLFVTTRESGDVCIKILDFGIAKVLSQETKVSQEVRGTPLYMAPEQAGGQRVGPSTDVWALGLIAFTLLTGRSYWRASEEEGATVMAVFAEILSLPLDAPTVRLRERGVTPPFAQAFDRWFSRCVNRDPSQRFATAGQAVAELAQALGVDSALARPSRQAASQPAPYQPTVVAITAPTALRETPSPAHQTASPISSTTAPDPPRRGSPVVVMGLSALALMAAGASGGAYMMSRASQPLATAAEHAPEPPAPPVPASAPPSASAAPSAPRPAVHAHPVVAPVKASARPAEPPPKATAEAPPPPVEKPAPKPTPAPAVDPYDGR